MKPFHVHGALGTRPGTNTVKRQPTVILAVGDLDEWQKQGEPVPADRFVAFATFASVTEELFDLIAPGLVLSPLLARDFDCIDLAQVLHGMGFEGRYRAMSQPLPDPDVIKAEIACLCPGLDFDVVVTDPLPGRPI